VADILAKHLSGREKLVTDSASAARRPIVGGGGGAPLKNRRRRGAVRPAQSASPDHHGSWSPHGSLSLQTG